MLKIANICLVFFSLDRPVTNNLILNTKCQPKFLLSFYLEKRRGKALFEMKQKQKFQLTFGD